MVYCATFTNHRILLEEVETKTDINELKQIVKTLVRENKILTQRFNILLKTIKNQNNLIHYLQAILESMMAQAERTKNELSCILTELAYCAFDTVMRSQLIINRLAKNFLFENLEKSDLDELNDIAQTISTEDVNWTQRQLICYLKKIQGRQDSSRDSSRNHERESNYEFTEESEEEEEIMETSKSPKFLNNQKRSSYLQRRRSRKNSTVSVNKQSNNRSRKRTSSVSSGKRSRASSISGRSKRASSVSDRSKQASSVSDRSRKASSVSDRFKRASSVSDRSKRASSVLDRKRASSVQAEHPRSRRASSVFDVNETQSKKSGRRGRRKMQETESETEDNEHKRRRKRRRSERQSVTEDDGVSTSNSYSISDPLPLRTLVVPVLDVLKDPAAEKYIDPEQVELLNKKKSPPKDREESDEYEIVDDVDASDEEAVNSDENEKSDSDETRTCAEQNDDNASDSDSEGEKNQDSDSQYDSEKEEDDNDRSPQCEYPNGVVDRSDDNSSGSDDVFHSQSENEGSSPI